MPNNAIFEISYLSVETLFPAKKTDNSFGWVIAPICVSGTKKQKYTSRVGRRSWFFLVVVSDHILGVPNALFASYSVQAGTKFFGPYPVWVALMEEHIQMDVT